ncbi:nicotinate-nucleotide adenylyltransferase [Pseudohaliea rubra]|uniref:Probable nicotinate-nucleotide adenylyltransferase n=1 Tax=Pseudohaliea rubra DSM 19751 TaxID=1265313 RepID=A0A095XSD3_9GAMM|nr:nicotinate-nucleotide adenylyltransferase [Pseudohaliea rubra]KGE02556.1 Nicotinate-nucleotide adenylyltransferase [Pseudohaliea rubra DSM 19751]
MTSAGPVAVFGGTFNPVHLGHLRSAVELVERLDLEELRFMPCALPPHREAPGVDAATRARLVELAIAGAPRLTCDRRELARDGPSYTIDSLLSLRAELGAHRPLLLVMGSDALAGLAGWHRWEELLAHCHIVALARPAAALPAGDVVAAWLERHRVGVAALREKPAGGVHLLQLRPLPISATEIRGLVQSGRSARYLVPDPVLAYLERHALYRQEANDCQQ